MIVKNKLPWHSKKYLSLRFICQSSENLQLEEKFDYIVISSIEDIVDIKAVLDSVKRCSHRHTRIILIHYNYLWHPLVQFAEMLKLKIPQHSHSWLSLDDVTNLLRLSRYEHIHTKKIILFPFRIPLLSVLLNRYIARLPLFRNITMNRLTVARVKEIEKRDYSVTVVVPCKNEAVMLKMRSSVSRYGHRVRKLFLEMIDLRMATKEKVLELMKNNPEKNIRV